MPTSIYKSKNLFPGLEKINKTGRKAQNIIFFIVFTNPSRQEAFGKTIVEAIACETPVVCFGATGPKFIVDHKVNGYKAEAFVSKDLANGIEWVLNTANYDKLCKNAREKVVREFDRKVVAEMYIDLYETVMRET